MSNKKMLDETIRQQDNDLIINLLQKKLTIEYTHIYSKT